MLLLLICGIEGEKDGEVMSTLLITISLGEILLSMYIVKMKLGIKGAWK